MFVFRSHEKIKLEELKKVLKEIEAKKNLGALGKEDLIFKQEQPILHVCCKTLENAEELLKKAQSSGFKHSGIISLASSGSRVVVEIIGSEQLSLPIFSEGKILVNDDFLKVLLKESNNRLEKGWRKIEKLEKVI
jgi:tRNA wybutosine-synthesizing protein 3